MRLVIFLFGIVSLSLGIIGVVLPILPTTPFILLASYLFAKSSTRFHDWLVNSFIYDKYIEPFINEGISRKRKWILLLSIDIFLLVTYFNINTLLVRIIILLAIISKHVYFHKYVKTY